MAKNPLETTTTSQPILPARYQDQERIFARAFQILSDAIAARAFPGASVAVTHAGELVALKAFRQFTYDNDSPRVTTNTVFDLASVSKVAATTTMAMVLYERGLLDLDTRVVGVLPEFRGSDQRRNEVTIRHLLAHSSGLPAYEKLFLRASNRDDLLMGAFAVPLKHAPGTHAEYSDVGFVLLGLALERLAGEELDGFCQREIFGPLGMSHTTYNPSPAWKPQIPPTADDQTFRKRVIQGEVNDENASVMGGVAGHAGVFSTASDLATFAHAMLQGGTQIVRPATVALFTRRELSPAGTSRALGWDTPSAPSQSGKYFSSRSFGHLGYTGTSLWIDAERQISITLLTNRTWPDSSNKAITEIRPRFHDAVMEALGVGA
ncbi:MAG TPA: serine hydrolase domain-containing protein [Terriglobales bacterium]|nr:serine hydrolase domain-containing protein [Terriglobales bacterium]